MTNKIPKADLQKWIELLRSRVAIERLEGANELASLAVRTRSRVNAARTRGTLSHSAVSRLPQDVTLVSAVDAFNDESSEVRRAVAFALGELADRDAVSVLERIGETDRDPAVRAEAADALGKIGGKEAVKVLAWVTLHDQSGNVRIRSVHALTELALSEPSGSREVVETLKKVRDECPFTPVKAQAEAALSRLDAR
jgi:HEAT repeat protein